MTYLVCDLTNLTVFPVPRYPGGLFVDSVVDWVATSVVGLPRILYYSKETLVRLMISCISGLLYSTMGFS
jgi:hypothetical protein